MRTLVHFVTLILLTSLFFVVNPLVVNSQNNEQSGIINHEDFEKAIRNPAISRETEKHKAIIQLNGIPVSPTLSSPNDLSFQFNSTGNVISWYVSRKDNGGTATLYQNGAKFAEQRSWMTVASLNFDINGLDVGTHNFTIAIVDYYADEYYDTVFVKVFPTEFTSHNASASLQQFTTFFLYFSILVLLIRNIFKFGTRK